MKKILIIEDDLSIAELERDYLESSGYEADMERDGRRGLDRALSGSYDACVVDIMLPSLDGFAVCRGIREKLDIPIMVVSARGADIDKIRGLGLGADDYLVKPFSPAELVARVNAHIQRYERLKGTGTARLVSAKDIVIDLDKRTVKRGNAEITVTATEWIILEFLAAEPGRIRTREDIFDRMHGQGTYGDQNAVAVHVRRLREKVERNPAAPEIIETVWGMGYRLKA